MDTLAQGARPCHGQLYLFSECQRGPAQPPERLTHSARLVLLYLQELARHYGTQGVFPSVKLIVKRAQVSERSVQRAIARLALCGVITIVEDRTLKTGRRFLLTPDWHPKDLPRQAGTRPGRQIGTQSSSPSETQKEIKSSVTTTTEISLREEKPSREEIEWVIAEMKPKKPVPYRKSLEEKGIQPDLRARYRKVVQKQADAWKAQQRQTLRSPVLVELTAEEDMTLVLTRAAGEPSDPLHHYATGYFQRRGLR